ncbi:hypothetical protein KW850_04655 [Bacillus sp. sid0103]|uniref:hypothetical protein n=1 Tax=Bacillus sp. sid0103 TaxID=2856337 RepID=UPI001C440F35|nr:hypothetical protein [Bacillus sp. sid0103]MBV7504557.1 hypothetical protein [Bacillus sp. sid0103]
MTMEPSLLTCLGAVLIIILNAVALLLANLLQLPDATKDAIADLICEAAENC